MATISAARSIFRSTTAAAAKFTSAAAAKSSAPKSSAARSSFCSTSANNLLLSRRIFRCPVELSACVETMQPFHTATASALMTSMLSITRVSHAWVTDDK